MKKTFEMHRKKSEKSLRRQVSAPSFFHSTEFDYKRDSKTLWKIVKTAVVTHVLNLNEILRFLSTHNCEQRMALVHALEHQYGHNITDKVLQQPESPTRSCTLAMLIEPTELYVRDFHDLLKLKSSEKSNFAISRKLVEILLALNNKDTQRFKEIYRNLFESSIEYDIERAEGEKTIMSKLLTQLLEGKRCEGPGCSASDAKMIAKKLSETREGTSGIDCDTMIKIFVQDTFSQLSTIFDIYEDKYGRSIQEAIKNEFQGQVEAECFHDMIEYTRLPSGYYARILRQTLDKTPIDYTTLIRIIIGHEGKDLCEIKLEYSKMYDETLDQTIANRIDIAEIKYLFMTIITTRQDVTSKDFEHAHFERRSTISPTSTVLEQITPSAMGRKSHASHEAFEKLVHLFKIKRPH